MFLVSVHVSGVFLVHVWYVFNMFVVCVTYFAGMFLVCFWYVSGIVDMVLFSAFLIYAKVQTKL